ncbi:DUF7344 domain-containing protein [Natronorarus salvus]|uniref:DUF7344 domain-containing protein n=1 Tax=Natronorarus salvus TaxID=3117733 RepID=UPI002F26A130
MSQTMYTANESVLSGVELAPDERYSLLASARRRLALDLLAETTATLDLEEFAAGIVAREGTIPADSDAIERVAISLHHVHLPALADADVLEYDPERRLIEPTDRIGG